MNIFLKDEGQRIEPLSPGDSGRLSPGFSLSSGRVNLENREQVVK